MSSGDFTTLILDSSGEIAGWKQQQQHDNNNNNNNDNVDDDNNNNDSKGCLDGTRVPAGI